MRIIGVFIASDAVAFKPFTKTMSQAWSSELLKTLTSMLEIAVEGTSSQVVANVVAQMVAFVPSTTVVPNMSQIVDWFSPGVGNVDSAGRR
jgi:hypothetical protein